MLLQPLRSSPGRKTGHFHWQEAEGSSWDNTGVCWKLSTPLSPPLSPSLPWWFWGSFSWLPRPCKRSLIHEELIVGQEMLGLAPKLIPGVCQPCHPQAHPAVTDTVHSAHPHLQHLQLHGAAAQPGEFLQELLLQTAKGLQLAQHPLRNHLWSGNPLEFTGTPEQVRVHLRGLRAAPGAPRALLQGRSTGWGGTRNTSGAPSSSPCPRSPCLGCPPGSPCCQGGSPGAAAWSPLASPRFPADLHGVWDVRNPIHLGFSSSWSPGFLKSLMSLFYLALRMN